MSLITGLVLPVTLLSLWFAGSEAQSSDHLCVQRRYWRDLLSSLESLNRVFSAECIKEYDVKLEFPVMLTPTREDRAAVVLQILRQILRLFRKPTVPWNTSKFLNQVYQIITELQNCMKSSDLADIHQATTRARFANLEGFLNEKENSVCAWEIVQVESRHILQDVSGKRARK